jgi:hypothetical protein
VPAFLFLLCPTFGNVLSSPPFDLKGFVKFLLTSCRPRRIATPLTKATAEAFDSIGVDLDRIVFIHVAHFTDKTVYQVRVDGYGPIHRGIPKELGMNSVLLPLFRWSD